MQCPSRANFAARKASNKSDANPETPRSQQADNTPQSGNGAETKQQSRNDSGKQEAQDTKGQDQVNEQSSGPCSFVLGTIVAMDGRLEAIEDINVGDLVVSRDDETWEDGTQPVNATFGEHHESVLQITYVIESDWFQFNKQVVTTAEHPFMVASVGWIPAAEMYVGDRIVTLDNEFAGIVAIEEKSEPQYAYNFEVDEFNTYAVTEDLLWVHNSCGETGENIPETRRGSPALKGDPYSPGEVNKCQSQTRREMGVNPDPDTPLPDQGPGKSIKDGVHSSDGKTRHSTGERNVASKEEHSVKPKGNGRGIH